MRVLVTGGAGFIGSHLVERLLQEGHSVRVLDNLVTGRREYLAAVLSNVQFIEGSICNGAVVRRAMKGIDVVFHQAALRSVPYSIDHPQATNTTNIGGTINVLLAARDFGVNRVVYASSSSVYGNSPELPKREDMMPDPVSPYAVSKLAAEVYCRMFYQLYGLKTISLRYFNVFGPRQDPESPYAAVVPQFMKALLNGNPPQIHGDGQQSRDFTHVDNVVQANLLAMRADAGFGEAFNIAYGDRVTIEDMARCLAQSLGVAIEPVYTAPRAGDVRHTLADLSKARSLLGYAPSVDFATGLRETVAWYKSGTGC